ncbi:MAG: hypothetical protein ACOCWM_05750 [Cyclobacteriaceae bacterium]
MTKIKLVVIIKNKNLEKRFTYTIDAKRYNTMIVWHVSENIDVEFEVGDLVSAYVDSEFGIFHIFYEEFMDFDGTIRFQPNYNDIRMIFE